MGRPEKRRKNTHKRKDVIGHNIGIASTNQHPVSMAVGVRGWVVGDEDDGGGMGGGHNIRIASTNQASDRHGHHPTDMGTKQIMAHGVYAAACM